MPLENKNITFKLLPKQLQFVNSTAKQTLFTGAWGASKSTALCFAVLKEATIKGAQILLCRKTYTSLRRTTMQTLLYGDNPILPRGSYKYNKVEQTIKLNGKDSTIYLVGLDSMEKIRSMNLSFVAIDEATELVEQDWIELQGRLRDTHGSRRIVACCNPASPSHFLYQKFFVKAHKSTELIRATTLENTHLPKDYIEALKELPIDMYNRFVLGEWVALEKQIYKEFSREKNLKVRTIGEFRDFYVSVDFGYTNPCAIGFFGVDGDNNIHLLHDYKKSGLLMSQIADQVQKYEKFAPVVIVDPSAPALIAELNQRGLNAIKANNDVDGGISRMQNLIHQLKFTADPNCTEFIKEIENYCYNDDGKPVKVEDHLCFIDGTQVQISNTQSTAIESLKENNTVLTSKGISKIAHIIRRKDMVNLYNINGVLLIGTDDHPVFVNGQAIGLDLLCKLYKNKLGLLNRLNIRAGHIEDTCNQKVHQIENTLSRKDGAVNQNIYIETYGKNITAISLKAIMSTIKISVLKIIILITWSLLNAAIICPCTLKKGLKTIKNFILRTWIKHVYMQVCGINQKRGEDGIVQLEKVKKISVLQSSVRIVAKIVNTLKDRLGVITSVLTTVNHRIVEKLELIILKLYAVYAKTLSQKINTAKQQDAVIVSESEISVKSPLLIAKKYELVNPQYVNNIEVNDTHNYFANNILVSNCDASRYLVNYIEDGRLSSAKPMMLTYSDYSDDDEEDGLPEYLK